MPTRSAGEAARRRPPRRRSGREAGRGRPRRPPSRRVSRPPRRSGAPTRPPVDQLGRAVRRPAAVRRGARSRRAPACGCAVRPGRQARQRDLRRHAGRRRADRPGPGGARRPGRRARRHVPTQPDRPERLDLPLVHDAHSGRRVGPGATSWATSNWTTRPAPGRPRAGRTGGRRAPTRAAVPGSATDGRPARRGPCGPVGVRSAPPGPAAPAADRRRPRVRASRSASFRARRLLPEPGMPDQFHAERRDGAALTGPPRRRPARPPAPRRPRPGGVQHHRIGRAPLGGEDLCRPRPDEVRRVDADLSGHRRVGVDPEHQRADRAGRSRRRPAARHRPAGARGRAPLGRRPSPCVRRPSE